MDAVGIGAIVRGYHLNPSNVHIVAAIDAHMEELAVDRPQSIHHHVF